MPRSPYQYSELAGKDAIRLICLHPCDDLEASVECSLIHTSLSGYRHDFGGDFHYIAISYVWGDPNDLRLISINEKGLYITASLESALRHIREGRGSFHVWADGVCINQKDVHDRNQQVRLMGDIYSAATHTIIFLGKSSQKCDAVLKRSNPVGKWDTPAKRLPVGQFERVIEEEILTRPWFNRVWILQELFLSQVPWLQCGKSLVRWNVFCERVIASESMLWTPKSRLVLENMSNNRKEFIFANESSLGQPENPGQFLFEILSMRRACGVSDPRDMIYAHLGLAGATIVNAIAIDYDKTVCQVYEDIALLLLRWITVNELLNVVENVQPENRRFSCPSWVPDWTTPHLLAKNKFIRPYLSSGRNFHYRHKGFKTSKYGNGWYSLAVPHILALSGINLGTIDTIFPKSFWPDRGFSRFQEPGTMVTPSLVDWLLRADDDFPKIRRLLVNFSARALELKDSIDIHESLNFGDYPKLIDIISNWAEISTSDDQLNSRYPRNPASSWENEGSWRRGLERDQEQIKIIDRRRKNVARAILNNLTSWILCYECDESVALLSTGILVQVSDSDHARVGDFIISDASWLRENHYIMRPCNMQIAQEEEQCIRADLERQVDLERQARENAGVFSPDNLEKYVSSWPIQTCIFVTSAFGIWQGIDS